MDIQRPMVSLFDLDTKTISFLLYLSLSTRASCIYVYIYVYTHVRVYLYIYMGAGKNMGYETRPQFHTGFIPVSYPMALRTGFIPVSYPVSYPKQKRRHQLAVTRNNVCTGFIPGFIPVSYLLKSPMPSCAFRFSNK